MHRRVGQSMAPAPGPQCTKESAKNAPPTLNALTSLQKKSSPFPPALIAPKSRPTIAPPPRPTCTKEFTTNGFPSAPGFPLRLPPSLNECVRSLLGGLRPPSPRARRRGWGWGGGSGVAISLRLCAWAGAVDRGPGPGARARGPGPMGQGPGTTLLL